MLSRFLQYEPVRNECNKFPIRRLIVFGIDVIAEKDEIKYGFQCKLYSSPVGVEAVQETVAGQKHHSCTLGVVVTNNTFTPQAKQLARESLVALWDRKKLAQLIKEIQKINKDN